MVGVYPEGMELVLFISAVVAVLAISPVAGVDSRPSDPRGWWPAAARRRK
jgi:hypothetical protein